MKVKELARFSEMRAKQEDGPVTIKKLVKTADIVAAVTGAPGASGPEIARSMGHSYGAREYHNVTATLSGMIRAKKPKIKRIKLDGLYRFYPINYKLTTDAKPALESLGVNREEVIGTRVERTDYTLPAEAPSIEQKAMEYVWEYPSDVDAIKRFVNWYKQDDKLNGTK